MNELKFPINCMAGVAEVWSGQYAPPPGMKFGSFLDIGANVGAFASWVRDCWPLASLVSYEPNPENFKYLEQNVGKAYNTVIQRVAVGDPKLTNLRMGTRSSLCSSQYDLGEQVEDSIDVTVIPPEDLPEADFVKIDAEGAELYIVPRLRFVPQFMAIEYHTDEARLAIDQALKGKMILIDSKVLFIRSNMRHRRNGILKYLRV